jgi:hypothetical protein
MSCLGLRELFVGILCEPTARFEIGPHVSTLTAQLTGPNGYYVSTGIRLALRRGDSLLSELQSPENLTKLLDAAICQSPYDALVAAECFRVIETVLSEAPTEEIVDLVASYASQYDFAARPIDCATAFAARVFTGHAPNLVLQLFRRPANTILNEAVLAAFRKLPQAEQLRRAEDLLLPQRIIAAFDASQVNGHVTLLAELFRNAEGSLFDAPEWREFASGRLSERLEIREKKDVPEPTAEESPAEAQEFNQVELELSSSSESPPDSDDDDTNKRVTGHDGIVESPESYSYSSSSDGDDDEGAHLHHIADENTIPARVGTAARSQQISHLRSEEDEDEIGDADHEEDRPSENAVNMDLLSSLGGIAQAAPKAPGLFDDMDDFPEGSDGEDGRACDPETAERPFADDENAREVNIGEETEEMLTGPPDSNEAAPPAPDQPLPPTAVDKDTSKEALVAEGLGDPSGS